MNLRNYILVTAGYWVFTLTDGALRMLVLLHFNDLGYSAVQIAFLFLAYEFMGILTNLLGGWVGSRRGLNITLIAGLVTQIVSLAALSFLSDDWPVWFAVTFVMALQALSGVAKDLTKMSSKSAVKAVAGDGGLFRLVAILTGSKNALKGVGFFIGAGLLSWIGFVATLWSMAGALAITVVALLLFLNADIGKAKRRHRFGRYCQSRLRSIDSRQRDSSSSARAISGLSLLFPYFSPTSSTGRMKRSARFSPYG